MQARFDYPQASPGVYAAMLGLERHLADCAIERPLVHLVKLRASQINGCAYCVDMHWKDLGAIGESDERRYMLSAWRESPLYSSRERAALAWTEVVTTLADAIPDAAYAAVRAEFDETGVADLTCAIVTINAWNRLAIAARAVPGLYQPEERHA